MAINPRYPEDWFLENILVFIFFPFVIWMDMKYNYTFLSMILILIFSSFHALGAHYTYAEMIYFDYITHFFGFERNHFDRVVHFLFGLLLFRILFEMIVPSVTSVKTALFFTFSLIVSISILYEILEWLVVLSLYPELSIAFLGSQGDIWDAQKDSFAAIIGALLNILFYKNYIRLWESKKYNEFFK
tara:strand:+ start:2363 stop:2923 length:561 start_codon:yes stop_codon:yes gene_type:complete